MTCPRRRIPCGTTSLTPGGADKDRAPALEPRLDELKGHPLTSHEVIVDLIAATTTRTGLKVKAGLDQSYYPRGIKITDKQLTAVPLRRHDFHGEWNYTILPE